MRNDEFDKSKDYERLGGLKQVIRTRLAKEFGMELDEEVLIVILSYFNINKQFYLKFLQTKDVDLTEEIHQGYKCYKELLIRTHITKVIGNIETGYKQNNKIVCRTKMLTDFVVLKETQVTTGFDKRGKYVNCCTDYLVFLRR